MNATIHRYLPWWNFWPFLNHLMLFRTQTIVIFFFFSIVLIRNRSLQLVHFPTYVAFARWINTNSFVMRRIDFTRSQSTSSIKFKCYVIRVREWGRDARTIWHCRLLNVHSVSVHSITTQIIIYWLYLWLGAAADAAAGVCGSAKCVSVSAEHDYRV